jgi:outer membrane biosynthesis protein TonB
MLPQSQARKKRNSSKVNLMISFALHALIVAVALYFAARQGLLGKQLKKISIEMVKEKPPEKPKEPEKPKTEEPPKAEPSRVETAKVAEAPKVTASPVVAPPSVAPPSAEMPSFEFEGGKAVETSSDPVHLYRSYMEYTLRSKWNRPDNIADDNYVAEVEVSVDRAGQISKPEWKKGSGDKQWDDSVKQVFKVVNNMDRPPPTNFPSRVMVRFDVQEESEPISQ